MMKARISAIMKEDKRLDSLAYAAIVILLADVVFSFYRVGDSLYDNYRAKQAQLQAENFGYDENGMPRTSFTMDMSFRKVFHRRRSMLW